MQDNQSQRSDAKATNTAVAPLTIPSGLRILLADDSEDNRFLILSYLNQANAGIDIAENGEIAARMFRSSHYDLVLMDVEMPVMDGYAATQEIRRFERETGAQPTPVLALTRAMIADIEKSLAAGFTGYLTKPIRKVTLLEAVAGYALGVGADRLSSPALVEGSQSASSDAPARGLERIRIAVEPGITTQLNQEHA